MLELEVPYNIFNMNAFKLWKVHSFYEFVILENQTTTAIFKLFFMSLNFLFAYCPSVENTSFSMNVLFIALLIYKIYVQINEQIQPM